MNIIEIKKQDIGKAGEILAMAFRDDPIFKYIFQTPENYDRSAAWLFSTWVRWSIMFGNAWMADDESGVVLMRSLKNANMSFWSMIRAGMLLIPFRLGWSAFRRFYFGMVATLDKKHAEIMGKMPHWYGWMIGVKPEHRGKGRQLMDHCFKIADASQLPIYIETETEKNVSLYRHKAFELKDTVYMKEGNFTLYFMVRNPEIIF